MSVESSGIGRKIIPGKRPQFFMHHATVSARSNRFPLFLSSLNLGWSKAYLENCIPTSAH